jgi:hypothetical protein
MPIPCVTTTAASVAERAVLMMPGTAISRSTSRIWVNLMSGPMKWASSQTPITFATQLTSAKAQLAASGLPASRLATIFAGMMARRIMGHVRRRLRANTPTRRPLGGQKLAML